MRQDLSLSRAALSALAFLLIVAAGCSRNQGPVPADFVPKGPSGNDLLTVELVKADSASAPAVRLRVYDREQANGFAMYRRLPGQGFEEVQHDPFRFDGTYNERAETFEAIDNDWQPNRGAEYMARGTFNGIETSSSPTTNVAALPQAASPDSLIARNIDILCPVSTSSFIAKVDSTPVLVWTPAPGAVRYLLRIRRLDNDVFFYGFTPSDGSHSYQLGSELGDILHENTLTLTSFFYWTVEALDGSSRIIGRSAEQNFQVKTITQPDSLIFCTP